MNYVKGILSGIAAIFIAEFVLAWPFLSLSKATGSAALAGQFLESMFSPKFWIVGILLFGVFFAASRGGAVLRVLLFWIPTVAVSAVGFAFLAMWAYIVLVVSRRL